MRVGVKPGQLGASLRALVPLWQEAEDSGFDSLWVFDHATSDEGMDCPEALLSLGVMAAQTSRITIGMLAMNPALRHPGLVASAAASIDNLTAGRLILGVGAGSTFADQDHRQLGLARAPLAERVVRLDEYCQVLRSLWGGSPVRFSGRHYELTDATAGERPVGQVRLWVCGGSRGVLEVAARQADGWNLVSADPAAWAKRSRRLIEMCQHLGRQQPALSAQLFLTRDHLGRLEWLLDGFAVAGADEVVLVFDPAPERGEIARLARRVRDHRVGNHWDAFTRHARC